MIKNILSSTTRYDSLGYQKQGCSVILKISFILFFTYLGALHVCVPVEHMCSVSMDARKRLLNPLELEL